MSLETSYFKATDEVELNGLLYTCSKETKKIVISVHGMATNCIKKRDDIIAKKVNEIGMDYLIFNNRGHDLMNYTYLYKDGKKEKKIGGTSFEIVEDAYFDILGAMDYTIENGYDQIYIMGHSLGSTKTVYVYNKLLEDKKEEYISKIKGILLLSLVDIPTAIKVYLRESFPAILTHAKNLEKEKLQDELMPTESFIHPISVKTFLKYSIRNNNIDFARFSDQNSSFDELNNIQVPLFMRWGNNGELILQDAKQLCDMLKQKIKNDNLDINYIDGANHSYNGYEDKLANDIVNFLKQA